MRDMNNVLPTTLEETKLENNYGVCLSGKKIVARNSLSNAGF